MFDKIKRKVVQTEKWTRNSVVASKESAENTRMVRYRCARLEKEIRDVEARKRREIAELSANVQVYKKELEATRDEVKTLREALRRSRGENVTLRAAVELYRDTKRSEGKGGQRVMTRKTTATAKKKTRSTKNRRRRTAGDVRRRGNEDARTFARQRLTAKRMTKGYSSRPTSRSTSSRRSTRRSTSTRMQSKHRTKRSTASSSSSNQQKPSERSRRVERPFDRVRGDLLDVTSDDASLDASFTEKEAIQRRMNDSGVSEADLFISVLSNAMSEKEPFPAVRRGGPEKSLSYSSDSDDDDEENEPPGRQLGNLSFSLKPSTSMLLASSSSGTNTNHKEKQVRTSVLDESAGEDIVLSSSLRHDVSLLDREIRELKASLQEAADLDI